MLLPGGLVLGLISDVKRLLASFLVYARFPSFF